MHGYIRFWELARNLERYLKRMARSVGGLPPSVTYGDKGKIAAITFGQWAKLPRGRNVLARHPANGSRTYPRRRGGWKWTLVSSYANRP